MISDTDFLVWLKRDGTARALLVEASVYSGGIEVVRTMSNRAFISGPIDSPAHAAYDDIIVGVPRFSSQLSELFTGKSLPTWGDIEIINESGSRDSWLSDSWDGRAVRLYMGDPDWSKSDYRRVLDGTIGDIHAPAPNRLALKLRDKTWAMNVPIQTNLIGGSTANKDQPKPLCFGQCFNVEPLLIVAATHQYQVHDGAIEAITAVRDNGLAVAYTTDIATGTFTLSAAPAGRITADVKGAKPGGIYLTKCADIVNHIVTTRTQLTADDIDATNFSAFNTIAPQTLGIYIRNRENVIPVLDELASAVGGFWTFSRDGFLRLGRLDAPSGSPVLELEADDIRERQFACTGRVLPIKTLRLGYARNYTPQTDGLAGAVTETNRALYSAEHQVAIATNAGIETTHLLARSPDLEPTLFADATEAATEASRRATLFSQVRGVYEIGVWTAPLRVNLGEVVKVTHPRFGFAAGAPAVVVGLDEEPARGRVTLRVWK